jgi:hypothetical protein
LKVIAGEKFREPVKILCPEVEIFEVPREFKRTLLAHVHIFVHLKKLIQVQNNKGKISWEKICG